MKRIFAIALAAVVLFPSCDKTKEDQAAAGVIDYMEFLRYDEGEEAGPHSKIVYTPTFDSQGRLVKSLEQWYFGDHESGEMMANQYYQTNITYNDANHTVYFERGGGYWDYGENPGWTPFEPTSSETMTCNDDLDVTSWREGTVTMTYKDGYLDIYDSDPTNEYWWTRLTYVWKDGDLEKIERKTNRDEGDYYKFTYTKDLNPFGNYDVISAALCGMIDGEMGLWAACLFGNHSKHLIATETEMDNNTVVTYTYTKDKKGRIVEVRRADGEALGGPIGGVWKIYWK